MSHARQSVGKSGEDLACAELVRLGYEILARRYRRRGGEIDIVARHRQTIVFAEVKARQGRAFGGGAEAITPLKRRRMAAVALDFLARHRLTECACRFDVVVVAIDPAGAQITVYPHAFDVD